MFWAVVVVIAILWQIAENTTKEKPHYAKRKKVSETHYRRTDYSDGTCKIDHIYRGSPKETTEVPGAVELYDTRNGSRSRF